MFYYLQTCWNLLEIQHIFYDAIAQLLHFQMSLNLDLLLENQEIKFVCNLFALLSNKSKNHLNCIFSFVAS